MDKQLEIALSLFRDPAVVIRGQELVHMNPAAQDAFPELHAGGSAAALFREHILSEPAERFSAAIAIGGKDYAVSAADTEGVRILTMTPLQPAQRPAFLSDGMLVQLLGVQNNVGMSAERIAARLRSSGDGALQQVVALLRRNNFAAERQLTNLNTAFQLWEGTLYFAPRPTDVARLCAELADTVGTLMGPEAPAIRFSVPSEPLVACVDAALVERLLLNLLSNSLAHTPREGEIRLKAEKSGEDAVLAVCDNGDGIPEEMMRSIFARFECRADQYHIDRAATAGLGLWVSSGIARLHGGALVIESREGKGTTVRARLPLEQPEAAQNMECTADWNEERSLHRILTELSGILDAKCYFEQYLD